MKEMGFSSHKWESFFTALAIKEWTSLPRELVLSNFDDDCLNNQAGCVPECTELAINIYNANTQHFCSRKYLIVLAYLFVPSSGSALGVRVLLYAGFQCVYFTLLFYFALIFFICFLLLGSMDFHCNSH